MRDDAFRGEDDSVARRGGYSADDTGATPDARADATSLEPRLGGEAPILLDPREARMGKLHRLNLLSADIDRRNVAGTVGISLAWRKETLPGRSIPTLGSLTTIRLSVNVNLNARGRKISRARAFFFAVGREVGKQGIPEIPPFDDDEPIDVPEPTVPGTARAVHGRVSETPDREAADHPRSEPFDDARPFVPPPTLRRVNGTEASEDRAPPDVTDSSVPISELDELFPAMEKAARRERHGDDDDTVLPPRTPDDVRAPVEHVDELLPDARDSEPEPIVRLFDLAEDGGAGPSASGTRPSDSVLEALFGDEPHAGDPAVPPAVGTSPPIASGPPPAPTARTPPSVRAESVPAILQPRPAAAAPPGVPAGPAPTAPAAPPAPVGSAPPAATPPPPPAPPSSPPPPVPVVRAEPPPAPPAPPPAAPPPPPAPVVPAATAPAPPPVPPPVAPPEPPRAPVAPPPAPPPPRPVPSGAEMDDRLPGARRERPATGWYPDPSGHARLRYWDGRWTSHVKTDGRLSLSRMPSPAPPPSTPPHPENL